MNANSATTNAQTMNTYAPRVMIMTFGRHTSTVNYTDIKKVRAYMKKKATHGFTIDSVYGMGSDSLLITLVKGNHVSYTPGFQLARIHDDHIYAYGTTNSCKNWSGQISIPEPTPVKYGVRSIKDGVVLEWETFATIEDARGYAEDDIEEGATESVIIAVNRDGSLGDVVETIRPESTPTIDHYRIRTVVKGVIVDGTNEPTELEARTTAQFIVDADPTGNTEAWIIPVMSDRTLGGVLDLICYIDPSEDTDWMFPDDDDEPTPSPK